MAIFLMLPDGTTGTNEWAKSGGDSYEKHVQSNDDDTSYVYETRQGHEITFTMANPAVLEGAIDFNEDVTVRPSASAHYEGGSGTVDMDIKTTGSGIILGASTENVSVDSSYPIYNGNSTTQKAPGTDWDYTGLENAQVKLECTSRPDRFSYLRVSYVYIKVVYTAVVTAADNATFFGANF
tara:strand:+ start:1233 stop:1775 length:543 start_codon:yes stop_codon:yes gene_type:complete